MFRVYTRFNSDIFKAHDLIVYLVCEVWCKADRQRYRTKLNAELLELIDAHDWFDEHVKKIYKIAKDLTLDQKNDFKNAFLNNNKIEELCNLDLPIIELSSLDETLVKALVLFFKELYTKFLGWELIYNKYGKKKEYYDELILQNEFVFCPCCGFGDIKTYNQDGHSPFDHYLPLKHYPFSAINFNNLFPLCHTCNSSYKGETDILKDGKKVFYPYSIKHPDIKVSTKLEKKSLGKLITKTTDLANKISSDDMLLGLIPDNDQISSWDTIFKIKTRYLGKIADHRISWLDDVRAMYRKPHIGGSYEKAFDEVITDDSNKYLGFLKSPYLQNLKSYSSLLDAMIEVSGDHLIKKVP